MMHDTKSGAPFPLGATLKKVKNQQGVNFALFSAQARAVELCLFDDFDNEIRFPVLNKTDDIFHIWIPDVPMGTKYGYRVYSEQNSVNPDRTSLSNPQKLMLDPYAKAVVGKPDLSTPEARAWFELHDERDNAPVAPKGLVCADKFNWTGDKPLQTPWAETVIYELHVKGFSQLREDLPEPIRGTYSALAHPKTIAYLQDLGITAVELLPINYALNEPHLQEKGLTNYWGYNPLAMFAVEPNYAATENPLHEFKNMVKTLHKAGIEVILDVVFNHTSESEKHFATFSQRGIDDQAYYWHDEQGNYVNWTGCGNMLNLSLAHTRRWVVDCLKYWVEECHVDGFRFDLGAVLGREYWHDRIQFNPHAALFNEILRDPVLAQSKLIAEPWDIGDNGYQLGNFPPHFAEWNNLYRDDLRRFWLWKSGELGKFAERFAGSSDFFKKPDRKPHNSVNFITAHDGFNLRDLVSYNHKHNLANGEHNRDGHNENYSYNHGIEGATDHLLSPEKSAVENQRFLSSAALLRTLLLSNGTPMLLAGDEFGNTQYGNNNVYCQDNETTWLKWNQFDVRLFHAVRDAIALRKKVQSLQQDEWWTNANVRWFNEFGSPMNIDDWHNQGVKSLQILLDERWLLLINGKANLQMFHLPQGLWTCHIGEYLEQSNQHFVVSGVTLCLLEKQG